MFSITGYKQFQRCELQWYFKNIVADARVKNDPYRKEITILSKLDSVEAWRGKIVDDVISRLLVNAINQKYPVNKEYFLNEANQQFDKQLEYAAFQKYREPDRRYTQDKDFAALTGFEFGESISDESLAQAKLDINDAINNLLDDKEFIEYLKSAKWLVSQRTLKYHLDRFAIVAVPDLIMFFEDQPPHIVDWKVHTYGLNTYDEQLIFYAMALYKVVQEKPHVDFPANVKEYKLFDYKLTEYQLLHQDHTKREYEITTDKLEQLSDKMSKGILEMYMKGCHHKYVDSDKESFETTHFIENCENCSFQKICKPSDHELLRNRYFQN